jgi:hypothetical protein
MSLNSKKEKLKNDHFHQYKDLNNEIYNEICLLKKV